MNIIFLLVALFCLNCKELTDTESSFSEVSDEAFNLAAISVLRSTSNLARFGWGICQISPWAATIGNEFLLLSNLCDTLAQQALSQVFKKKQSKGKNPSLESWMQNRESLSQIPVETNQDRQLLLFLQNRWLAKSCGFFTREVDWFYPLFGFNIQVNPATTNSYARDPNTQPSRSYLQRMENWKKILPHPQSFPLVFTRAADIQKYLPCCFDLSQKDEVETILQKAALTLQTADSKVMIDLTHLLPGDRTDQAEWMAMWEPYRKQIFQLCKKLKLNPNQFICIQKIKQEEVGGIRILPIDLSLATEVDHQHQYLLEWVSHFGLTANLIELDRWPLSQSHRSIQRSVNPQTVSKEVFASYLDSYDLKWKSSHPQKTLMHQGMMQVLKGLFASLKEENWEQIMASPTRASVVQLCIAKIQDELESLSKEEDESPFFDTASRIEKINAHLSALIEVCSPFTPDDFSAIFRDLLTTIPDDLKPLSSCGLHSSGMTCLGGILKALEKSLGAPPRILYGANTYFECVIIVEKTSNATSISNASEEDWKRADLLMVQFNPVWKRCEFQTGEYTTEKIGEAVRKCLNSREGKPLTLALDSTLDYIDSPRVGKLLHEFQAEIRSGKLNIICYRSGLKFDLFGMDNQCGGAFYMIHNRDSKWAQFDSLCTDQALQTDRLSLNWFCLAYKYSSSQLKQYQKQIFDNSRALLEKVPPRLYNRDATYRIIPVNQEADPSFIDLNITGPFHQIRACLLGGCLYLNCLMRGHPIFFRRSLGFYHLNFGILFGEKGSTMRLTLGLDPTEVDLLVQCLEIIDGLNGSPWQDFREKLKFFHF